MLGSILSSLGGSVGKHFGGGILSTIGRYAGKYVGNFLERKWFHKKEVFHKYANLKESFSLSSATYGAAIPLVFGKNRVPGKIFWADKIRTEAETTSTSSYFTTPKQVKSTTHYTDYKYFLSFAMCICEGEIVEISRIWNGNELLDISQYKFRLYKGSPTQMPDPLINAKMNNQAPGYRDLAYIIFEDMPLADFGNVIPNLSFEVMRKANVPNGCLLEDMVKQMIMIPGSGEYVYDTIIQKKVILGPNDSVIAEKTLNSHNLYNIPNSVHSLNQLGGICENIEWVAPVACWFGDSLNLSECLIRPAVEFKDDYVRYGEEWIVGEYNRNSAYEITKDQNNNPRYGGSINDQSILRYLTELRSRNYKIMFYPMFFLDVDKKPWRGHLTGNPNEVANFFHKKHGYNEFILHYANLVKNHVDAFIIGTELIGLTKICDNNHNYPAVNEFVALAEKVKNIVGNNVLVSYAADWSEYHHTEGGWFNLDPLWASDNIDFIGIDAYFPVTDSVSSFISTKDLEKGFSSGECYDYIIDRKTNIKKPIEPKYAIKNLKYWWENTHTNPNNQLTSWKPKSKKIWFTEYGFPSINKSPNQPNVFFDPFCSDGGAPRYSTGEIDFAIQRRCIRAFIEYWSKEEYIDNMFLWTWDARPYPAWPHMDIWRDGYLWEKGHWVNDKFGACSIASIILEISNRCKLDIKNIEVKSVDEVVGGAIFNHQITGSDSISTLRSAYFFDISASNAEKITFVKRGTLAPVLVNHNDLIKLNDYSYITEVSISEEQILSKVDIYFQDQLRDYDANYLHINSEKFSNLRNATLRLPLVISPCEAAKIGRVLLKNAAAENRILQFNLPISHLDLEPSDFITLEYNNAQYLLRVIKITFSGLKLNIIALIDDINNYHNNSLAAAKLPLIYKDIDFDFQILDLPFKLHDYDFPYMAAYLNNNSSLPLYVKIKNDLLGEWSKITMLQPTNCITKIVNFTKFNQPNFFLIDEVSILEIKGIDLEQFDNDSWKLGMISSEIIAFKNIKKTKDDLYEISYFIRGAYGTEKHAKNHEIGSRLIILKQPNIIAISEELVNQELEFKVGNLIQELCFIDKSKLRIPPTITSNHIKDQTLHLAWITRRFISDTWIRVSRSPQTYNITITDNDQVHNFVTTLGENKIEIDISQMNLSDQYLVDIV